MKIFKNTWLALLLPALFTFYFIKNGEKKSSEPFDKIKLDTLTDTWKIIPGKKGIVWKVDKPHTDHLEFSGLMVSAIIKYGNDSNGNLILHKKIVWPMLRTIPNDTHASLIHDFGTALKIPLFVNGKPLENEKPYEITFTGILTLKSHAGKNTDVERVLSPSTDKPAIVEKITVINKGTNPIVISAGNLDYEFTTPWDKGVYGAYLIKTYAAGIDKKELKPGESVVFDKIYIATKKGQHFDIDVEKEIEKRKMFIDEVNGNLILETPDDNLDLMFQFAKLRAVESIFKTKGGLMHGPGGSRYYAAIWANDQAEYVNPFFPFLGVENGNKSAINSYRLFAQYMNDEYKPLPSSIIAEGTGIWNGAGDRGDAAMIAYGASRFALAYGDKDVAGKLLPLIEWCLTYCEKNMLPEGVIASDCDELEFRFPAGKANLSTNMLAYGAYLSAADLLDALGENGDLAKKYRQQASELRQNCEKYFGANVQGFDTYKYYEGNTLLRSWICFPLTMGVYDRKRETIRALLSGKLWSENGILTRSGDSVYWDRATLIALRGILKAGEVNEGMKYFEYYTRKRLLGDHVPYAVEAWPEGNQRHLSAESGLYARTVIEGLFGITPTGFSSFTCAPRLPGNWNFMKLKNIKAFQRSFDIEVSRNGKNETIEIFENGKPKEKIDWDGKNEVQVNL